jgi:hypothetical protein
MNASPDVAGGVASATLANGTRAQQVFGCTVEKTTGGTYTVTLDTPIANERRRVWVQNCGADIPWCAVVDTISPTQFLIKTYRINFDSGSGGSVVLALSSFAIAFGVSAIPG